MPQLTLSRSTPAGRAASLINEVYGQFVPELTVAEGDKLSLESPSGPVSSLADITTALFESAGKVNDGLGTTDGQRTEAKEWLSKVEAGKFDSAEDVKSINEHLTPKTFVAGESLTAADLAVFAAVHPYISKASHADLVSHAAVTRHFDHVQNLPLVATALARSSVLTPATVPINVSDVQSIEIKPDVKVKKPKAADAAAAAAGEQPPPAAAAAKAKKVVADQKKGEQRSKDAVENKAGDESKKNNKTEKKEKVKKPAAPAPVVEAPAPWMVDLRVGRIIDVKLHPDADSLYVETIDIGEPEPRTVVSGLVKYMTLDQMRGATLITVCNLKPVAMRGVKSYAMVLCATSPDGKDGGVEFVNPPAGSEPGDRVYFDGFEDKCALELLNPKKKIFETVQPGFTTLADKAAAWVGADGETHKIVTKRGTCAAATYVGASLS